MLPSWLDDKHYLFGLLFALDNKLQATGDHFFDEITAKQWFLLACITLFDGKPPSLLELAHIMGCSHQNTKQIVLKLCQKGYLELLPDERDKRRTLVKITPACEELCAQYQAQQVAFMDGFYKGLTPEQIHVTLHTLLTIQNNLEEINHEQPAK